MFEWDSSSPHQCVCIHEDTLAVVCECPAVEFGEGDPKIRSLHECKISFISTVHHVHQTDLIIQLTEHCSATQHTHYTFYRLCDFRDLIRSLQITLGNVIIINLGTTCV